MGRTNVEQDLRALLFLMHKKSPAANAVEGFG